MPKEQPDALIKLTKCLHTLKDMRGARISLLKSGHQRDTFSVAVEKKKYIGRVGKDNNVGGASIASEVRMLKFFEYAGITFTPKVLHYNKTLDISIEEFVGTHDADFKDFITDDIDLIAKQLVTIHQLPAKDFRAFCKKENFPLPKTLSEKASIDIFGTKRFAQAVKTCPDKKVLAWIAPRLQVNVKEASLKHPRGSEHLVWGDVGSNIRSTKNQIFFIDWEFFRIEHSPELAYIKIHSHPRAPLFRALVKAYAKYSKISEQILYEKIAREEKIIRVNDVIWAAMKWGESVGTAEEKKYQALTCKRMKLFEKIK